MSRSQYGLGYHRGRASMLADIVAAQAKALASAKAQQRAAGREVLAGTIGLLIVKIIPVTVTAMKKRRHAKPTAPPES